MKSKRLDNFVVVSKMLEAKIRFFRGQAWALVDIDDNYVYLGHAPKPKNSWEGFWYHVYMGLLMHYPLYNILRFSWKYKNSFQKDC